MSASVTHHIPILLEPITDFLLDGLKKLPESAPPGLILDCTLGGGGHTSRLIEKMKAHPETLKHCVLGLDQDPEAIARNEKRFESEIKDGLLQIKHSPFSRALKQVGDRPIYGLMADLGISSDQIDSEQRGFSFRYAAPLDMRMNISAGESLAEMLAEISETDLADLIWKYGEERFSRKIARKLISLRAAGTFPQDTLQLAEAIAQVFPPPLRFKRMHPATQTFQALRIAVNQELDELETLIREVLPQVHKGGHIAILSFHSLEDRLVKETLRQQEIYSLPQRKAIQASEEEVEANSRSRSAKLRIAVRKPA